ncbi:MAG: hypothetical protein H0W49_09025 [Nitrospirales bacterium]|nr:hypothetical protein [Nitrospirales bacterium]
MDWIPAISTTSLLALVLWLGRNLIITRLTNSVRHEYDEKLETLKAKFKKSEELFKAELHTKESQIDALRSGALSGIVSRQAALYERRLRAVEQLWGAVISLAPAKGIASFMANLKYDVAAGEAAKNPRFREIFKAMGSGFDVGKLQTTDASKARPFVSPLAWAYYSAYQSIVMHAVFRNMLLQGGVDKDLSNTEEVTKLVKVVLPHQEAYIEKWGSSAFYYLLEELESKILFEIDSILQGKQSDTESIEKAAQILRESDRLMESDAASKHGLEIDQ